MMNSLLTSTVLFEVEKQLGPGWHMSKRPFNSGMQGELYEAKKEDDVIVVKIMQIMRINLSADNKLAKDEKYRAAMIEKRKKEYEDELENINIMRDCPNVIVNIDAGFVEKRNDDVLFVYVWISMKKYVPLTIYRKDHALTEKDIVKIGIDIGHALEACEKANVVHCDIKPGNIFAEKNGNDVNYVLGDFGISGKDGRRKFKDAMTPGYEAPEQLGLIYEPVSHYSDIYSLGMTLYVLAGGNIHERKAEQDISWPAEVGRNLYDILKKSCKYDCDERYQSAKEFVNRLEELEKDSAKSRNKEKEFFNNLQRFLAEDDDYKKICFRLKLIWDEFIRKCSAFRCFKADFSWDCNDVDMMDGIVAVADVSIDVDFIKNEHLFKYELCFADFEMLTENSFSAMENAAEKIYKMIYNDMDAYCDKVCSEFSMNLRRTLNQLEKWHDEW